MIRAALRLAPVRLPGHSGSASRRGVQIPLLFVPLFLMAFPAWIPAAPLALKFDPGALITPPDRLVFLDPHTDSCSQEAGCLQQVPHSPLPAALAMPLRAHLPAAAARILLPAHSRWLLAAAHPAGPAGWNVIPAAPQVGQKPQVASVPFDVVAHSEQLPVAAMFLIGLLLLLASTALGFVVRSPSEPPGPEPELWIPQNKALPKLVTAPVSPLQLQRRP